MKIRIHMFIVLAGILRATTPNWEVVSASPAPVIGPNEALPHGIHQGFETGQFFREGGIYYYAANELGLCPHVVWDRTTRAGLWSAPTSAGPWTRRVTLRNSSSMASLCGLPVGKPRNACSWAPTLVFGNSTANGSTPVWNLFYSACEAPKDQPGDGIVHAVSTTGSIEGPFVDLPGVAMPLSHAFTAWRLDNGTFFAFRNNVPGARDFSVGLERAAADNGRVLGGVWSYDGNAVPFPCGPENPVVTRSADRRWFYAVYDALEQVPTEAQCSDPSRRAICTSKTGCNKVGLAWSADGTTWTENATALLTVQLDGAHPCGQIRTPLGLVSEPDRCAGCYSVLWTGYSQMKGTDAAGFTPVCHAIIRQRGEGQP